MYEILREVADLVAKALHAAERQFNNLNDPLAEQMNEALTEFEDAIQDSEATEP